MDAFATKHVAVIQGVLSCFGRALFRGYLPLMSGYAMAEFLTRKRVQRRTPSGSCLPRPSASSNTRSRWRPRPIGRKVVLEP